MYRDQEDGQSGESSTFRITRGSLDQRLQAEMAENKILKLQQRNEELEVRLNKVRGFSAFFDELASSNDGERVEHLHKFVHINRELDEVGTEKNVLVSKTIPDVSAAIEQSESRLEQIRASETFDAKRFADETATLARLFTDEKKVNLKLRLVEEKLLNLRRSKARQLDKLYFLQGESSLFAKIDGMLLKCGIKGSEFSFKRKWNETAIESCVSNEDDLVRSYPSAKRLRFNSSVEGERSSSFELREDPASSNEGSLDLVPENSSVPNAGETNPSGGLAKPFRFSDPVVPVRMDAYSEVSDDVSAQPESSSGFIFSNPIGLISELSEGNLGFPTSKVPSWRSDGDSSLDNTSTCDKSLASRDESPASSSLDQNPVNENHITASFFLKAATIFASVSQSPRVSFDSSNSVKCFKNSGYINQPKPVPIPQSNSSKTQNSGAVIKPLTFSNSTSQTIQVPLDSRSALNSTAVIKPVTIPDSSCQPMESSSSFSSKNYDDEPKPSTIFNSNFQPIRIRVDYSNKEKCFDDLDNAISPTRSPTSSNYNSDDSSRKSGNPNQSTTFSEEEREISTDDGEEENVGLRTVTVVEEDDDDDSTGDSYDDDANDCIDRRSHGKIVKLISTYGFIEAKPCCQTDLPRVIFFHRTGLFDPHGWKHLKVGDDVNFEVEKDHLDRFVATDVRVRDK